MAKLNQIIAVVNGLKTETKKSLTALHRQSNSVDIFNGLSRTYKAFDEEGEQFPDENKEVQFTVNGALTSLSDVLTNMFDTVLTQDTTNCQAKADIVVGETTIAKDVPVTYLMFLEKQLNDISTFVESLPVLDFGTKWEFNENLGLHSSQPTLTNRTKKVMNHKVLYEATKEHPAQIEKWNEDVAVGQWETTKFSGAISNVDKSKITMRVKELQKAVKFARESANSIDVVESKIGKDIFEYLLN